MRDKHQESIDEAQKQAYANQAACGQARTSGGVMGMDTQACRPSLQDRVDDQLRSALHHGSKAHKLSELSDLLNRNPEVRRILDLIEEVC